MKNIIKLLKVLCQLFILLIIIDRTMSQCGYDGEVPAIQNQTQKGKCNGETKKE